MDALGYLAERGTLREPYLEAALPRESEEPAARTQHATSAVPGRQAAASGPVLRGVEAVGARPRRASGRGGGRRVVHTYSLVHDDLPCMDDDVERRGRHRARGLRRTRRGDGRRRVASAGLEVLALAGDAAAVAELAQAAGSREWWVARRSTSRSAPIAGDAGAIEAIHRKEVAA